MSVEDLELATLIKFSNDVLPAFILNLKVLV